VLGWFKLELGASIFLLGLTKKLLSAESARPPGAYQSSSRSSLRPASGITTQSTR
jgi:hypothetical protein